MRILFILSLAICLISFVKRNEIPSNIRLHSGVLQEPSQTPSYKSPFSVKVAERQYKIKPLYNYDLYGLVVSYRHHDGDKMLHKAWGDHINVADVCVVWSKTAQSPWLNKLNFWNGQFTCNVRTSSSEAWAAFDGQQLSNNHLITEDPTIRRQLGKLRIGDQIRIRGWLAEYGGSQGAIRGSSITRSDSGNGACETVYVRQFELLASNQSIWRSAWYFSLVLLLAQIIYYFSRPFKRK